MTDYNTLTDADRAALAVWASRFASEDTMLAAVHAAVAVVQSRREQSEDARLAVLEQVVSEVRDMLCRFDTPGDPGRTRTFVSDLTRIVNRVPFH